ncbi:hypothetical protein N7491_008828 [Penicillium cf. griseofulvum]|uniref:Glucosamine 6-phosphate N-acetyltransferase n=1 Tax=Penicillium cf. griseofulvum TaxID=2972120 RepID=A0A9W9JTN4_9EURO|nr:hypothetical protein N7472_005574 [Penicillium cf. griseofulvum]KAJ5423612.1 hypothetical protein N7491_008828 [Penicillium cf. griseofulvum]KAJ5431135.1 hypothetical protein N7445_008867 [Penicillium cf. griseofulvum]
MASDSTLTTVIQPPPGPNIKLTLPSDLNNIYNPPIFNDAMKVRMRVFVDEQHCSAAAEIDDDDARSWQWIIYASPHAASAPTPVGVIRLVPPPQPPHERLTHQNDPAIKYLPQYDWTHEPCIKLTRVAVMPEYRGFGLGRRLVEMALKWAGQHAAEIDEAAVQLKEISSWDGTPVRWQGLVLVHAQADAEKMYKALGFETDESLGRWDEEGIEHVGMFRRVEVAGLSTRT